jgi:PelA/Pel-15E family pectate lyase
MLRLRVLAEVSRIMKRILFVVVVALILRQVSAEPVTSDRLSALPAAEHSAWQKYLERSQATARADQAALQAEVTSNGMAGALQAPDGGDFKLPARPDDAWYASDDAKNLADVIISYQAPSGGWSKHTGYAKGPRKPGMQWTSQNKPGEPSHYLATFDNRSTTEQLYFLAYIWNATKREDCKAAFIKGLNFILDAQYPNGGWPQVYPLEGAYHDDITFNDDAMTRVLGLLQSVGSKESCFAFLDDSQRAKAAEALAAGIQCVLKTQIELNGKKTVWCAQYDPITLQPSNARKMEPATLSGTESARILELLMSINNPSPQVVACIESGLAWFEQAKIVGISRTTRDGKTVYEPNPPSTEVYWARFYDLKTGKPVFPGRDGVLYDTFEAMAAKNKVGYDYYSTQPGSLLNTGQKKWRKMMAH